MLRGFDFDEAPHRLDPLLASDEDLPDGILPRRPRDPHPGVREYAELALLSGEVRPERLENRARLEPLRSFLEPSQPAVAAPAILLGPSDHAGANRVESDVTKDREQVRPVLDELRFEASLVKRSDALVAMIDVLGELLLEPLHAAGQRRIGRAEDEVEVVRHQLELVDDPSEAADDLLKKIDEDLPIAIIEDDVGAVHAAIPGVIDAVGHFHSQLTSHAPRLPRRRRGRRRIAQKCAK